MNFDLSREQRVLEEGILRFFANEFPLSAVREVVDGEHGSSDVLWKGLSDVGLFGVIVPEEYGGAGLELLDLAVAAECLGYAASPGPFLEHVLATLAIAVAGDKDQRARWLPGLAEGTIRASFAFAEGDDAWMPEDWRPVGDSLTTTKRWVLNPAGADVLVVGVAGGFVLVERSAPGIEIEPLDAADRTRRVADVSFEDTPSERLPGGAGTRRRVVDAALVLLAADAAGGARRCLEMAVEYGKTREQFGVTIGHFQALKHQLADMAVDVEPMRGLYWYAAHAFDRVPEDASKFAALAKAHLTDRYVETARQTVEVHGGIGYTWECDVHFFLKRAVFDRVYFASPRVHRARVATLNGWRPPVARD